MRPADTSPAADDAQIELWRRMPGTEKYRVIGPLSKSVAASSSLAASPDHGMVSESEFSDVLHLASDFRPRPGQLGISDLLDQVLPDVSR